MGNTRKSIKYENYNVVVPTNEFFQLFLLKLSDYRIPTFSRNAIIMEGKKNIDDKAKIQIITEFSQFIKNEKTRETILSAGAEIIKYEKISKYLKEIALFSREELIMYLILFNHYVENIDNVDEKGNVVITFKEIHLKYRNKTLKKYSQIDEKTLESYKKAILRLGKKKVGISVETCQSNIRYLKKNNITSFIDEMLHYVEIKRVNTDKTISIKYNLGKFGKMLITSKRMTSKFPVELLEKPYKQIAQVFIGIYLSKMIFINKRKNKNRNGIALSIPSILRNIIFYDINGKNMGITLFERLENKECQNYALIRTFDKQLIEVLELYKKYGYIKQYSKVPITGTNYKVKSTKVQITF